MILITLRVSGNGTVCMIFSFIIIFQSKHSLISNTRGTESISMVVGITSVFKIEHNM